MVKKPAATTTPIDPFDLASLRLNPDAAESVGVEKLLRNIPTNRPDKHAFIRVHSDENYRMTAGIVTLRDARENETYLLNAAMSAALPGEYDMATLFTSITKQGVLFVWPVKLDGDRPNTWNQSARAAAELAMTRWIRVVPNMQLGCYELFAAVGNLQEPVWPTLPFQEILRISFGERLVTNLNHPLVKRLRGAE
jgi:hypothetical protein